MKKFTYLILPMTAMLLTGCIFSPSESSSSGSKSSSESGSVEDKSYNGYYDLSKYKLNSTKLDYLQIELNKLMIETHRTLIPYADFKLYTKPNTTKNRTGYSIDQISKTNTKNQWYYTGKVTEFSNGSYEREHVWPCANSQGLWTHNEADGSHYVDSGTYVGGGSDLYHVRPSSHYPNNIRGNSRFVEFTESEKASKYRVSDAGANKTAADDGPYVLLTDKDTIENKKSEPADEMKGDVARLIVYVWVHYNKINQDDYYKNWGYLSYVSGQLDLSDVIGAANDKAIKELLVRWNNLDPVSETEKLRNDTVQQIQGNRNPFVDYPHLMSKLLLGK